MQHKPKLFTNMGDVAAFREKRHERARRIEVIVRRDYLDDDADAADLALGLLESDEGFCQTDEYLARQVAALIEQA